MESGWDSDYQTGAGTGLPACSRATLRRPVANAQPKIFAFAPPALVAVVTNVVVQTLTADETPAGYRILFRLVGTAYVACGLIAWRRRPDSRSALPRLK